MMEITKEICANSIKSKNIYLFKHTENNKKNIKKAASFLLRIKWMR